MPTKSANPGPRFPQKIPKATPAKRYLRRELEIQFININRTLANDIDNNFLEGVHDFSKRLLKQNSGCTCNEEVDLRAAVDRELHLHLEGVRIRVRNIMTVFWFRFRFQSSCLSVFMYLHEQGLVSLQGLEESMELRRWQGSQIGSLGRILGSFSKFQYLTSWTFNAVHTDSLIGTASLQWLATLVIRGAQITDLNLILNSIRSLGGWGEPNMLLVQQIWPGNTNIQANPAAGTTGLPNYLFSRSYGLFGCLLP